MVEMPKVKSIFDDSRSEMSEWLRTGMAKKNIRQTDLAKMTGIPRSTLQYKIADPGKFCMLDIWKIERVIGPFRGGVRSA